MIHRVIPTVCQNNTCNMLANYFCRRSSYHHTNLRLCEKNHEDILKVAMSKNIKQGYFTKTCKILFSIGGIELIPYYKFIFFYTIANLGLQLIATFFTLKSPWRKGYASIKKLWWDSNNMTENKSLSIFAMLLLTA